MSMPVAFDHEGTIETLNGNLTRSAMRIHMIQETSIASITNSSVTFAMVTTIAFLGALYSPWVPESMKIWIPFTYFWGMICSIGGAFMLETKRGQIADEEDLCAGYERELLDLGVRLKKWKYIDVNGGRLDRSAPAVTQAGLVIMIPWLIWATPQVVAIYRVLTPASATAALVATFVGAWMITSLINMTRSSHRKFRFGYKVWVTLSIVTIVGMALTAIHEHAHALQAVLPFLQLRQ